MKISSSDQSACNEDLSSFKLLDEESWSKVDFDNAEFSANISAIQNEEIYDDEDNEESSFRVLSDEETDVFDERFCNSFYSDAQLYIFY